MATGVLFGSPKSLLLQPGAYSIVDASALNLTPPFAYNVVCVLGAGLGGTPMTPYLFNDPIQAQRLFGATTPLAEAIRFAFQGGANGGASAVVGVRIDNCAQAYGSLAAVNGGAGLQGTFDDYGAYGSTFSVSFYPGSVAGTMAVVQGTQLDGTPYVQKIDNETSFSQLIERLNNESPITLAITEGGTAASQTLQLATSQIDGRATVTDNQGVQRSNQAYAYQYPSLMTVNTTDSMLVTFSAAISWTIASIDAPSDTWTTDAAHPFVPGHVVKLTGTTLPPEVNAAKKFVIRTAPSSTTFTVAEALDTPLSWAVGGFNDGTDTLTAAGNTLVDGDVVQLEGGLPNGAVLGRNYFVRDKSGDDFRIAATPTGSAIALSGSISGLTIKKIAGGLLAISGSVAGAKVILQPELTSITASNPSDFNGSRQAVKVRDVYDQVVSNAVLTATAYSSDTARFTLQGSETWGHLQGRALPGSIFTIASGIYAGTYQIQWQEWDGLSTDKVRVVRKLSGDRKIAPGTLSTTFSYWAALQFAKTQQPATAALETRLPANGLLATGGQYLTVVLKDSTSFYVTQPGDTIQGVGEAIANQINQDDSFPAVVSAAYNANTYTSTLTVVADKVGTVPNSYPISILVNVQTTLLVSAGGTALQGGTEPLPPRNAQGVTSGSLILGNGFDSVPTYQRWLDGLDVVKYLPIRYLVPAGTDNLGVQIAFADHCALMSSTPQRRERMCILGHGLGWTKQQIRERAETFQSERVVFVSPGVTTSDPITGNPKKYAAFYSAAIVAGILAAEGNGISDPITHTYLKNLTALELTYQPGSVDLDSAIASGVLTLERDPSLTRVSRGFRVTRGITTWRVTVNSALKSNAFEAINVINQSDFIAADIREMQEVLFIGQGIFADTLEQVRLAINLQLGRRSRERIIYGFDASFTQVTLNKDSRNALDAAYKIYPVPGLEFILNTQLLFPIPQAV